MFENLAFREAFPEFADIAKYPDAMISFWASLAEAQVNPKRWKNQTLTGIQLYVAHEITVASQNLRAGSIGGTPGASAGPVNSKTVGSVTASYDTAQIAERDGGYWNLTNYGRQFLRLARIFGSGAVQL
jgi:hypothetical protein